MPNLDSKAPDVTQVISDEQRAKSAQSSEKFAAPAWDIAAIMTEESQEAPLDLSADPSLKFREQLNRVGNRYKIEELFAEGGYGQVYRARDRVLGRIVVVKSMRAEFLENRQASAKFISEAKLTAQLDHPGIVPLFSLDSDDKHGLHLAMKLVDGITIKDYLDRLRWKYQRHTPNPRTERKNLESRLELFLKICEAVAYVHGRGIIHRDLKPENIMLGRHNDIYVMDWGCAAPAGTVPATLEGTPAYLAPEIPGDHTVRPSGDIFALGMILFEMVTLRPGVSGVTAQDVLNNIVANKFEPVNHYRAKLQIPPALAIIINKARAYDPGQRYASAQDLAQDVRNYLFNDELLAQPDTIFQKAARLMYRNRTKTFAVLVSILFALAALAAYGFYRENRADDRANRNLLRHLKLQRSTEVQAEAIDAMLTPIREQLRFLANSISLEYETSQSETKAADIVHNETFNNPDKAPEDLSYAPFFRKKISLGHASIFLPKPMTDAELASEIKILPKIQKLGWSMIRSGIIQDKERSGLSSAMQFLKLGSTTRRISVLTENGVGIRYPGMYESLTSKEFITPDLLVKRQFDSRKYYWSLPLLDSARHCIVSCWGPLVDTYGKELGTVGVDLCFSEIVQMLYEISELDIPGGRYYLLNNDGQILFDSRDVRYLDHFHWADLPAEKLPTPTPFPPQLWQKIKSGNLRQIDYTDNGRRYVVAWSPIRSADWYLVQVIDEQDLAKDQLNAAVKKRSKPL